MDISAANIGLSLAVASLFPTPQPIQGFAADNVHDFDEMENVETLMGVDGFLSGGWVWKAQRMRITLQADSVSNPFFDQWNQQMQGTGQVYVANGVLRIPSIALKIIMTTGYLTQWKLPGAKKLVEPRNYGITWNLCQPVPG